MTTDVERRPSGTGWGRRVAVSATVAAVLAVAVVLAVRSDAGADSSGVPDPTGGPSTTATHTDQVPVTADLVRRDGGAAETTADVLAIDGNNGSALLSFASADVDTPCVQQAELVLTQLSGDGPIDVWVSLETDAGLLPDGTRLGTYVIARESPSVTAPSAAAGEQITWDVTPLLRWQQEHQPGTDAVVLVVKPAPNRSQTRKSFAALESGDMATLHLTRSPACD